MMSYDEPLTISDGCRDYFELSKTPGHYPGQEFLISWNSQELLQSLLEPNWTIKNRCKMPWIQISKTVWVCKGAESVCGPLVARIRSSPSRGVENCSQGAKEASKGCQGSLGSCQAFALSTLFDRGRLWPDWATLVADMRGLILLLLRWPISIRTPITQFCSGQSWASIWALRCSRRSSISPSEGLYS